MKQNIVDKINQFPNERAAEMAGGGVLSTGGVTAGSLANREP